MVLKKFGIIQYNLSLLSGVASDYAEPYSECLPTNYTIDDVKRVVVDQRRRPELGERWKVNEVCCLHGQWPLQSA